MRHLSLFSGVGGVDLGAERAGATTIGQVEFDPHARKVLKARFGVPIWNDVTEVTADDLPDRIDVLSGGFPCTDISVAGRRAGLAGDASGLWFEFARLIAEITPNWVLIENVPGLLSSNGGRDLGTILGWLEEHGYEWAYRTLDSQWFGVAQRRRRVFIVASRGAGSPARVLFEPESVSGHPAPSRQAGPVASALTRSGSGLGGGGADDNSAQAHHLIPEVAPPLISRSYKSPNVEGGEDVVIPFAQNTRDEVRIVGEDEGAHVAGALAARAGMKQQTYIAFQSNIGEQDMEQGIKEDFTPPLKASQGPPAIAFSSKDHGADATTELAPTLRAMSHRDSHLNGGGQVGVSQASGVRRLMPVECERLQGFPDGWSSDLVSNSQAYRQMGNAVTVPVAEWIFSRLISEQTRVDAPDH